MHEPRDELTKRRANGLKASRRAKKYAVGDDLFWKMCGKRAMPQLYKHHTTPHARTPLREGCGASRILRTGSEMEADLPKLHAHTHTLALYHKNH